jgi:hypothetical protein
MHCQLYKVNNQPITPPILRIKTHYLFDLLAIDLLQFPRSFAGNGVALVTVDHYSKGLSVVPLRDKKSHTVVTALRNRILPCLPRIPTRILSDNGPEMISENLEEVLREYNISHIYSTPYTPASNGLVERVNRTIINFLKGLVDKDTQWDQQLHKAVITYNNTIHSQILMSPSQCILTQTHDTKNTFPVSTEVVQTWRDGHPNFSSFQVDQKVIRKIHKTDSRLKFKLGQMFEGPYLIKKVQSNGVSYEIMKVGDPSEKIFKAHHKQLRSYKELPSNIGRYILPDVITQQCSQSDNSDDAIECPSRQACCFLDSSSSGVSSSDEEFTPNESRSRRETDVNYRYSLLPIESNIKRIKKIDFSNTKLISKQDVCQKDDTVVFLRDRENVDTSIHANRWESTPVRTSSHLDSMSPQNFQLYLDQNEADLKLFSFLEQSFGLHADLLDQAQLLLSSSSESLNDVKEVNTHEGQGNDHILNSFDSVTVRSIGHEPVLSVADVGSRQDQIETHGGLPSTPLVSQNSSSSSYLPSTSTAIHDQSSSGGKSANVSGFSVNDPGKLRSVGLLKDIKSIIEQCKQTVRERRSISNDFRRDIWEFRQSRSSIHFSGTSLELSEASDIITELPDGFRSTPRRALRSRGSVSPQPNVLPFALEHGGKLKARFDT